MCPKVVLITGAARRVGAVIARFLHAQGMNVIIHYLSSAGEAEKLAKELNNIRPNSAYILRADLNITAQLSQFIEKAYQIYQRLDVLINNASRFYPTPMGIVTDEQWQDLMHSNLKAPFFLAQAAKPYLAQVQGCIINIADIHAEKPIGQYSVYCIAKAGLVMLTKSLAKDLGPEIRVNAVAPGSILWPEGINELEETVKNKILEKTALKRKGKPEDIAKTAWFLVDNDYITGQVIGVDGGQLL